MTEEYTYDAFISYKREDSKFAQRLVKKLESYRPPKGIKPDRRLSVFIDVDDIHGSDYYDTIERALITSKKLIVICSPKARGSQYISDEIHRFMEQDNHTMNDLIPILYAGIPNNEATKSEQETEKAFPDILYKYMEMPLARDYRGFFERKRNKIHTGAYRNNWFTLLATLLDVNRDDLEERERKRNNHRRIFLITLTTGIFTSLLALIIIALMQLRQTELEQIKTSISLSEAKLALNQELESRIEILRAGKKLNRSLLLNFWNDQRLQNNVISQFLKIMYHTREHSRLKDSEKIIFSPKGNYYASLTTTGQVELYDVRGNIIPLEEQGGSSSGLEFSPDEKFIMASGEKDQIWYLTGKQFLLKSENNSLRSLKFSPNGQFIVGIDNNRFRLWNAKGTEVNLQRQFTSTRHGMHFSPNSQLLLGEDDNKLRLWSTKGNEIILQRNVLPSSVDFTLDSIEFSPDSKLIALNEGGRPRLWKISGEEVILPLGSRITPSPDVIEVTEDISFPSIAFSADSNYVAMNTNEFGVQLWTKSGKEIKLKDSLNLYSHITFSPNGKLLSAYDVLGGVIQIWDILEQKTIKIEGNQKKCLCFITFSPDGKIVTSEGLSPLKLWDISSENVNLIETMPFTDEVEFSPDGTHFISSGAVLSKGRGTQLWKVDSDNNLKVSHKKEISSNWPGEIEFNPDGSQVKVGNSLVDIGGYQVRTFQGRGGILSPNWDLMATYDSKGVKLWELNSPKALTELNSSTLLTLEAQGSDYLEEMLTSYGSKYKVKVIFSPNGEFMGIGDNNIMCIWNISGKKLRQQNLSNSSQIFPCINDPILRPDLNLLAGRIFLNEQDKNIHIWDWSKSEIMDIYKSEHNIQNIQISPLGDYLFSSTGYNPSDFSILWKLSNKMPTFKKEFNGVIDSAFSPDGTKIALASYHANELTYELSLFVMDHETVVKSSKISERPEDIIFSPNNGLLLVKYFSNILEIYSVLDGKLKLVDSISDVSNFQFHPNQKLISLDKMGAGYDLWYMADNSAKKIQKFDDSDVVFPLNVGNYFLVFYRNKEAGLWTENGGKITHVTDLDGTIGLVHLEEKLEFSSTGKHFAMITNKGVRVWDEDGRQIASLGEETNSISRIAISPKGKFIAMSGDEGVKLWNISTKQEIKLQDQTKSDASIIVFSQDERLIATNANNGDLWFTTGEKLLELRDYQNINSSGNAGFVFSPEGDILITLSSLFDGSGSYGSGSVDPSRLWHIEYNLTRLLELGCSKLNSYFNRGYISLDERRLCKGIETLR